MTKAIRYYGSPPPCYGSIRHPHTRAENCCNDCPFEAPCDRLAEPAVIHPNVTGFVVGSPQPTIADLTARLAAAYAATSAALTELALGNGPSLEAYDRGIAEGERRATAAIVAWLRDDAADGKTQFQLARAIRRGDHLKGTSNE